jgi:hypothetical protein
VTCEDANAEATAPASISIVRMFKFPLVEILIILSKSGLND